MAEPQRSASPTEFTTSRPEADLTSPAHRAFERLARGAGMDPGNLWVGGYADYEWEHLRKLLDSYQIAVAGRDVLEFGCNVGASSVVLAAMGGNVTAIDVNADAALIAQANLERHGLEAHASTRHVADTRYLPFENGSFDLVVANSVLEYLAPGHLDAVLAELHRATRKGGILFVCGTASRTAIREVHSGRWLVNFLPAWVDRLTGKTLQRGIDPFHLARSIRGRFAPVAYSQWKDARRAIHGRLSLPMHAVDRIAKLLGCAPGWFTPNIELVLTKEARDIRVTAVETLRSI